LLILTEHNGDDFFPLVLLEKSQYDRRNVSGINHHSTFEGLQRLVGTAELHRNLVGAEAAPNSYMNTLTFPISQSSPGQDRWLSRVSRLLPLLRLRSC
jgi:hypothetical protein